MLVEVSKEVYRRYFLTDSNPFITEAFISLVEKKCERVIRLMKDDDVSIGLILGMKDGIITSPFSAPFGGFHYSHEHMFYDVVFGFLSNLRDYVAGEDFKKVLITLPPDPYQVNMNAKFVNAFIRLGFNMATPDLNNWVDLKKIDGTWCKNVVEQNCRKAIKNGLAWSIITDKKSIEDAYSVILRNRKVQCRKIYMTLDDILEVNTIIPVDFFAVKDLNGNCVGSSVFYRGHKKIVQCVFMGDDTEKRNMGIMNLMYKNCFEYYKNMDFDYIDLGISCLEGEPNTGLIRFKELHNCATSLRYTFSWSP
ncbi:MULTISPECIES: hypothetical protein [Proteiniphilum]|uniref:hypothetical protein n=1 Tax=Proteiniphilum TaxID=294702 RepID=UPI001EEAB126|nr:MULTISPECIES: hypothetical protein [Proteiniphilum]ULB33701.1 hypothetical protein KDN43_11925 [Proteiniphilum propionicum]